MITKETLDNGLTLITEAMPELRSVAIGVWLKRGSRHEPAAQCGVSHFIEHMVFKGTKTRSAERIAAEVDSIGGYMDAFTAKEYASFHLKVLDEHLPLAVEILADIVLNPLFDPTELTKEKKVIFEEINMVEDTPDDLVMELFCEAFWPGHPLGRPILGTKKSVSRFRREHLAAYFARVYHPANIVIAAAGHLEHGAVVELVRRYFSGLRKGSFPCERSRAEAGHDHGRPLEEGAGAGAPVHRHACPAPGPPRPLRELRAQHRARRLDVVASLPERAREARPRLLDLLGHHFVLRRRAAQRLRGDEHGLGARGDPAHARGDAAPVRGASPGATSCAAPRTTSRAASCCRSRTPARA